MKPKIYHSLLNLRTTAFVRVIYAPAYFGTLIFKDYVSRSERRTKLQNEDLQ